MKPNKNNQTNEVQNQPEPAPIASPAPEPREPAVEVSLEMASELPDVEIEGEDRTEHFKSGFVGYVKNWVPREYWRQLGPNGTKLHDFCLAQFRTRAFAKARGKRTIESETIDLNDYEYDSDDQNPDTKIAKQMGKVDEATLASLSPEVRAMVIALRAKA